MNKAYGQLSDLYRQRGLSARVGFGTRPAVLVIDFILGFTDRESPLAGDLEAPLSATLEILRVCRDSGIRAYFTTVEYDPSMIDAGLFPLKVPSLRTLVTGTRWVELDPRLQCQPGEILIRKKYASAFFGTALQSMLTSSGIDTVIVTGCTTSGCVRATVVDAMQYGFHAIVPAEAVGDRAQSPHEASLFDIDSKYGDVVQLPVLLDYLTNPTIRKVSK